MFQRIVDMRGCALCILGCREQTNVFLFMLLAVRLARWTIAVIDYHWHFLHTFYFADDERINDDSSIQIPSSHSKMKRSIASSSFPLGRFTSWNLIHCSFRNAKINAMARASARLLPIFNVPLNRWSREECTNCHYLKLVADTFLENCIWRERGRDSGHAIFFPSQLSYLSPFFHLFSPAICRSSLTPFGDPFLLHFLSPFFLPSFLPSVRPAHRILGFLIVHEPPYYEPLSTYPPVSFSCPSSFPCPFSFYPCDPSLFSFFRNFASIRSCWRSNGFPESICYGFFFHLTTGTGYGESSVHVNLSLPFHFQPFCSTFMHSPHPGYPGNQYKSEKWPGDRQHFRFLGSPPCCFARVAAFVSHSRTRGISVARCSPIFIRSNDPASNARSIGTASSCLHVAAPDPFSRSFKAGAQRASS